MALCTAAQVRAYANSGTAADDTTLIDPIIARIDAMFARHCGFPRTDAGTRTMEDATYTLYIDARRHQDPNQPARLYLPMRPIVSVTSVHVDPERDYGSDTLVASTDYDIEGDEGAIVLRDDATEAWSTATRANKVVAVLGYDTVPDDLEEAAIIQAVHMFRNRATAGSTSTSTGQNSRSVSPLGMLPEVKERLADFCQVVP